MSDSRYIAFLDADDIWLPTKLERQIELLDRCPEIGLVCSDFSFDGPGAAEGSYFQQVSLPTKGSLFERFLHSCFVLTSSVVVRREVLEQIGVFNESLTVSEDLNLWLRIALRWDIAVIPEVLVIKRRRTDSLSVTTAFEERWRNGLAALQHVKSCSPGMSRNQRRALERAIAESYYVRGSEWMGSGDSDLARAKFRMALQHHAFHWRARFKLGCSFLPKVFLNSLVRGGRRLRMALRSQERN